MNKIFVLLIILLLTGTAFAGIPAKKYDNPPQGTFKKKANGDFVQYDKNGKKIGVYRLLNGKLKKIR